MLAFTAVTVAAVALVAAAALVGTDQGLSAQQTADRRDLADRAAEAAARAYRGAGGWDGADLGPVISIADGAAARMVVRDRAGGVVLAAGATGRGSGMGGQGMRGQDMGGQDMGGQGVAGGTPVTVPVSAAGTTVGSVSLVFPTASGGTGRPIAWTWVAAAALVAIILALAATWLITRMLTRPLTDLTVTAREFAAGDHAARAPDRAPGELGELARAFNEAAERVQVSELARRQLSADVAHELRTPLATLQAGLEELRDGLAAADTAALAGLHDQTLRLAGVVNDLADLSAADAARLTLRPEPVDLVAVARGAADAHEASLRAAGLTLTRELETPVVVLGDERRLHQVVGNLLQNCAQHCRDGDTVTLRVARERAAGRPDPRFARLTVSDTGPGIPPADLPHVLTRFWRGHDGEGAGSGLGMAIVESIVTAHRGSIRVESDGRTGTTVTVDLPERPGP